MKPLSNALSDVPGVPAAAATATQLDGNPIAQVAKPTKAPLETRRASPNSMNTSGIEGAMALMADQMHPVRRK